MIYCRFSAGHHPRECREEEVRGGTQSTAVWPGPPVSVRAQEAAAPQQEHHHHP